MRESLLLPQAGKQIVRISRLCRGAASGRLVGSAKAAWGVKRAADFWESQILKMSTSSGSIWGNQYQQCAGL